MIRLTATCILLIAVTHSFAQEMTAKQICNNMIAAIEGIQTLRFKMKKYERINDEMKTGEQDVKFNKKPRKVYTYIQSPNTGIEVLYIEGKNNGHAYINPNAFPYINLNLDPYGSVMRKGNHHTVNEVGFDYIKDIVSNMSADNENDFDRIFQYEGDVKFNNRDCYKLIIDFYPYKLIPYKVKEGENITDIAYRLHLSDFMIVEINKKDVSGYHDVEAGQTITVPNAYARKTILYIDKQNNLPVVQMMYDDNGLFEKYEFYNVIVNSKIAEEEFSRDYDEYGF